MMYNVHQPTQFTNADALGLFEALAEFTWDTLGHARRLDLSISEETITDLTALQIARCETNRVSIKKVTKREERIVGFDWMWLIDRPGSPPAMYAIQAKKMKLDQSPNFSYGSLKYKTERNPPRYQIDDLEAFANRTGATPMYCLYNSVDHNTALNNWRCRQPVPPDVPQMGCTLVPLEAVRFAHGSRVPKNFQTVHADSDAVPWRCLFHPNCSTFSVNNLVPRFKAADERRARLLDNFAESLATDEDTVDMDEIIQRLDLVDLVPNYSMNKYWPIPEKVL